MDHLIFRLEGPMMSFGDVAVDDTLPVSRFPALSMIVGLMANAMGIDRTEPERIVALQEGVEIASRIDRPGSLLRDYQTAHINKSDELWSSHGFVLGRSGGTYNGPVVMNKYYWADASVTVAVKLRESLVPIVAEAMSHPCRPLFLGRNSCPPSCKILHMPPVQAANVLDALLSVPTDTNHEQDMLSQWPEYLGGGKRILYVTDIKDWRNNIHTGRREVREGVITFSKKREI